MNTKLLFSLAFFFVVISQVSGQKFVKKVLLEEFTTTMCGNCPPKSFDVNTWHDSHPSSILITIHEGSGVDSMSNKLTDTLFRIFRPSWGWFAPAIMIDRTTYPWITFPGKPDTVPYMTVAGFDTIATRVMNKPALFDIEISGTYDSSANKINATVITSHNLITEGTFHLNLFLVEDSVTGTGYPAYDQECYDQSFAKSHYSGYTYTDMKILGYPHRHVLRKALLGGSWGVNIPISGSTPKIYSDTFKCITFIPSRYNKKRLSLVASVNRFELPYKSRNAVLNANEVKLKPEFTTSIREFTSNSVTVNVYPNPASDYINLSFDLENREDIQIFITDMYGKSYQVQASGNMTAGSHFLKINTGNLGSGFYLVTVKTKTSQGTFKFLKK